MGKKLDDATRDEIATRVFALRQDIRTISAEMGVSAGAITSTCTVLEICKEQNWEKLLKTYTQNLWGINVIDWAASRARVKVPDKVYADCKAAVSTLNGAYMYGNKGANTAATNNQDNENVITFVSKVATGINETNEKLEKLCCGLSELIATLQDEFFSVLSDIAPDIKDNHNANADVIGQRLDAIQALLEKISKNTRRSGT